MTKTIDLPALDHSGNLTPHVLEAMKNGATAAHHATDKDILTLTFAKTADATAFVKLVAEYLEPVPVLGETVEPIVFDDHD